MPITHNLRVREITKDEYHSIDYEVMELAFNAHNRLGRLHEEAVYQREVWYQCQELGLDVRTEVPVTASFRGFSKTYCLDMVVENAVVYELKAASSLASRHRGQLLNYLFLVEVPWGKLVNFRPPSVEYEYVTTTLGRQERCRVRLHESGWRDLNNESQRFGELIRDLLTEWGAFLDTSLYRDAVVFLLGGEEAVRRTVAVKQGDRTIGRMSMDVLTPETGFHLSSVHNRPDHYQRHLTRLLRHADLTHIQWVNMNRHDVTFKTLSNQR